MDSSRKLIEDQIEGGIVKDQIVISVVDISSEVDHEVNPVFRPTVTKIIDKELD